MTVWVVLENFIISVSIVLNDGSMHFLGREGFWVGGKKKKNFFFGLDFSVTALTAYKNSGEL